eukprot:463854-Rhodomonas_salina.1
MKESPPGQRGAVSEQACAAVGSQPFSFKRRCPPAARPHLRSLCGLAQVTHTREVKASVGGSFR